ncbi:MAG: 4'-phosphopantetheinyl transferase superfamily protein [Clostridia bacterium]|nr:4'-phosphopantetheinyl transferase superfamily protein [Clostridia bacterium]
MIDIYFLKTDLLTSKSEQKKLCSLLGYEIVRQAYSAFTGKDKASAEFAVLNNGKPLIKGADNFHFSISHSGNAVAVAVSSSPLGLDIEILKPANLKIADRFFTQAENAYIFDSPTDTNRRFFEIWTKKEAVIKQSGMGLAQGLEGFDVTDTDLGRWLCTLEKDGFILSICAEKAEDFRIIEVENPKINNIQT